MHRELVSLVQVTEPMQWSTAVQTGQECVSGARYRPDWHVAHDESLAVVQVSGVRQPTMSVHCVHSDGRERPDER